MQYKWFDPQQAKYMDFIVIVGKRGSGKTVLVKDLLNQLGCNRFVIFSPSGSANYVYPEYTWHIDKKYSKNAFANFVTQQKEAQYIHKVCVVFEGCMYNKSMYFYFMNSRTLKTKIVMVIDHHMAIPSEIRCCIDYVFIFNDNDNFVRKHLYKKFAGMFPTFDVFCQVFDQLTSDPFTCMVINNTVNSNKLDDQILWYKASYVPEWKFMANQKKKWLDMLREELMQRTWHPKRVIQCLDHDERLDIFGVA